MIRPLPTHILQRLTFSTDNGAETLAVVYESARSVIPSIFTYCQKLVYLEPLLTGAAE
jgi:hypothetical protein